MTTRLRLRAAGRLLVHDALVLTPSRFVGAVGTAFVIRAGAFALANDSLAAAADRAAREAGSRFGVRIGIGRPAYGGISVRALGERATNVRAAMLAVIEHAQIEAPLAS